MRHHLLVCLLAGAASCSAEPPPVVPPPANPPPDKIEPAPPPAAPVLRLPASVLPTKQAVALTIVPSEDVIKGTTDIALDVVEATNVVWLNALEIDIDDALVQRGTETLVPHKIDSAAQSGFIGFAFDAALSKGPALLHIAFRSRVSPKDDRGVFREELDGHKYVFSQFENIDARRAFPCFDEPPFKIPWKLTLRVKEGDVALSNTMPLGESKDAEGFHVVQFGETKPLPSYLVAFAVGPFELVDGGKTQHGTPVRIATPIGMKDQAAFAASATAKTIDLLEAYLGVPYPYDKMDIVPIPHLVSFGAMENAGMITAAMNLTLARKDEDTLSFERNYVDVMAHELAHQWFGDLVTMAFWDDVWLNEAFATWMGNKIVQRYHPEWKFDLDRFYGASGAMYSDALVTARSIRQPIKTNDDIQNAFDNITYEKGATVIGMFESYLGDEAFRKGVQGYLKKHSYRNATGADFLSDLGEGAGKDVRAAFSTFLDQPGVPLVSATLSCDKGKGTAKLQLSQERFLPIGSKGDASSATWQTPVCVRYADPKKKEGEACTLLSGKTGELPLPGKSCPAWVMPKAKALGYYRFLYTKKDIDTLLSPDRAKALSLVERISVIEDSKALAQAGKLKVVDTLARVPDLVKNAEPEIISSALGVANVRLAFLDDAARAGYARFIDKTFGAKARELGFQPKADEPQNVKLLRQDLVWSVADGGEDTALINEARATTDKWFADPKSVDVEMARAALAIAASYGDRKLFDRFMALLKTEKDVNRRQLIIGALSSFRDPALAREALNLVLSDQYDIRETVWMVPSAGFYTREVHYEFIKNNFDALMKRFPTELQTTLVSMAQIYCDEQHKNEAEAFLKDRVGKITGGPRRLAQALESTSLCIAEKKEQAPSLNDFFKKY